MPLCLLLEALFQWFILSLRQCSELQGSLHKVSLLCESIPLFGNVIALNVFIKEKRAELYHIESY